MQDGVLLVKRCFKNLALKNQPLLHYWEGSSPIAGIRAGKGQVEGIAGPQVLQIPDCHCVGHRDVLISGVPQIETDS